MENSFDYQSGTKPLLISMPHNSSEIPEDCSSLLTAEAQASKDTDWFTDKLYDFATSMGVHIIKPAWSRYYIDLNRDPEGQDLYPGADNTELCPTTDFNNQPLYLKGNEPATEAIEQRLNLAWRPYHQSIASVLDKMREEHGYAVLFDAHTIASKVPRFFEGQLPDFNFGTAAGQSCAASLQDQIEALDYQHWSVVANGRFKGGYITRHFGAPENDIHAIQLELSQATYLDEATLSWDPIKADKVKQQLQTVIQSILDWKD